MDPKGRHKGPSGSTGLRAEARPDPEEVYEERRRARSTGPRERGIAWGAFLTGLGLGGSFDAILLHQVLQWHHLASSVVDDQGLNITLDGVFHAVMYGLVVAGVVLVWAAARRHGVPPGRWLTGWVLLGAGVFHLFDAFVFHWALGLHRINPEQYVLFWDMVFFGLGLALVAVGAGLVHRVRMEARADGSTPAS